MAADQPLSPVSQEPKETIAIIPNKETADRNKNSRSRLEKFGLYSGFFLFLVSLVMAVF